VIHVQDFNKSINGDHILFPQEHYDMRSTEAANLRTPPVL